MCEVNLKPTSLVKCFSYPSDNVCEADVDKIKTEMCDGVPLGEDDGVIILYQDEQQQGGCYNGDQGQEATEHFSIC